MQFNKDSNGFIVAFVVIMVIIVSISLSLVSSGLKPLKDRNEMVDKKSKILKSVLDVTEEEEKKLLTGDFVLKEYDEKIKEVTINSVGEPVEGENAFEIDFKKETRKSEEERTLPVFIYDGDDETYYIIPLIGLGLWDEISGYIALKEDFITIKGAAFDHKAETPGLGAKIVDYWFRNQFQDKKLYDKDGNYAFKILKGEGNEEVETDEYLVDGMSGATLTVDGANAMIEKCVEYYRGYFDKQNNS